MSKSLLYPLLLSVLLLLVLFSGCIKENDLIGTNLIPSEDTLSIKFDNTTSLVMSSYEYEISTNNSTNRDINSIGVFNDPFFGVTRASVFASFSSTSFVFDKSASYVVDSVKLFVSVGGSVFPEEEAYNNIEIYEMTQALGVGSNFFSDTDPNGYYDKSTSVVGNYFKRNDTVQFLQFDIDKNIGINLLNPNDSAYNNSNNFVSFYPGFYFKINDNIVDDLNIMIDLYDEDTYLKVSYTENRDTVSVSKEVTYTFNKLALTNYYCSFNVLDYVKGSGVDAYLDTTVQNNQSLLYYGGIQTKLSFPEFSQWIDSMPIAINKAQLVLPMHFELFDTSNYLPKLNIYWENEEKDLVYLLDQSFYNLSEEIIGGRFDEEKKAYIFNIKNHLQYILNVNDNGESTQKNALLVIQPDLYSFGSGAIIENDGINGKIELNIWYTDFREK